MLFLFLFCDPTQCPAERLPYIDDKKLIAGLAGSAVTGMECWSGTRPCQSHSCLLGALPGPAEIITDWLVPAEVVCFFIFLSKNGGRGCQSLVATCFISIKRINISDRISLLNYNNRTSSLTNRYINTTEIIK